MGAPFWLRFGVGGLSQISPNRAAALANRFLREPGLTVGYTAEELKRLAAAEKILAQGEARTTRIGDRSLHSYHFTPARASKGTVLLLHGWSGDSRAMAAFPHPLLDAGYEVIALDFPAHGRSDGSETDVMDAADAVRGFLASQSVQPDHIIAHSFGGAVASVVAEDGRLPATFTSIAAPTCFALVLKEMAQVFNLSPKAEERFSKLVDQSLGRNPANLNAAEIWRNAATHVLVLHGPEDSRVSFDHALHLADLPNVELVEAQGVDHCEIIYAPETVDAALRHIRRAELQSAIRPTPLPEVA